MSLISVNNLSFSYDSSSESIFENVSFKLDTSWRLALIGRNGRGKTTFLNLLMNKYEYTGQINSSVNFSYFPYEVDITKDTVELIGDDWEIRRELSLLNVKEVVLYRKFSTLSAGEQTKILLAAMFIKENSFLLIDEPTNHLDYEARKILANYLKAKNSFILVSHDRNFIDAVANHIMSINRANIEVVSGNFSSWIKDKERRDNLELFQNKKLKKEISRLNETSLEKADWSFKVEKTKSRRVNKDALDKGYIGHKAAKMMKRSKAIEKRMNDKIEEKSKLLKNIEQTDDLKLTILDYHSNRFIEAINLALSYGDNLVFKDISFEILKGDKVLLKGINGSGKSSIIKIILNQLNDYSGSLFIAKNLKIAYVSQDTGHLSGKLSDFEKKEAVDVSLFRTILRKLGFKRESFDILIDNYSMGQKKKVLVAAAISKAAHLYIFDEPLNYIDVDSRIQIENLIKNNNLTCLFVEHDKMFADTVCNKIIEL